MIYESLLAPTEVAPTLRELKRALLTYDKVILVDPADRDVIPSNAFMSVLGMPFLGFNFGPIRPMGKQADYDTEFSKTVDAAKEAIAQGLVEVKSTYQRTDEGVFTIGAIDTGGYPLDPRFVFWLYRSMASDQNFLRDAVPDVKEILKDTDCAGDLALPGRGDGSINDIPALPELQVEGLSGEQVSLVTTVARSRLASFIKYAGYCEAKNLVPLFSTSAYSSIAQRLLTNARETLLNDDDDQYWTRRSQVLDLCHEEFLVDQLLDNLEIRDIIKLRTKVWGEQANAREGLFQSVHALAKECDSSEKFTHSVAPLIEKYRRSSNDLLQERERLNFQIRCEIGKGALVGGAALVGVLTQLGSPATIGLTLVAGGAWVFDKAIDYVPALRAARASEDELKRGAGFGLHNFYSRLR